MRVKAAATQQTTRPGASAGQRAASSRAAGAGSLLFARVLSATFGWMGTIVIARTLAPSAWGALTFVFGLLGMIGLVADLQVGRIVLRDVINAGEDAGSVVGSYLVLRLLVGLASLVVSIGFVLTAGYESPVVWTTAVLSLDFLFASPAYAALVWFQSRLSLRPVAVGMVIGACFQLAMVLALAATTGGAAPAFATAYVLADAVWLVWELGALRRAHARLKLSFDRQRWGRWLKEAVPLAIGFGLASLYYKLDVVLLGQFDSLRAVGQYSIGYKFADVAVFVPVALLTPVLTLMVSAWPHNGPAMREHFRRAAILLGCAALVLAVGFALVAQPLIAALYGPEYADSADAARFLVAGASIQFFSQLFFVTLVTLRRNWAYVFAGLAGVILNVGLNLVLIPTHSFNGSAVATVVTEIGVLLLMAVALRRNREAVDMPWKPLAILSGAAALMALVYVAAAQLLAWPIAAAFAGMAFAGVLFIVRIDGDRAMATLHLYLRFEHVGINESLLGEAGSPAPVAGGGPG